MNKYNRYKAMWLIAMFDLPTDTAQARRAYTSFRKELLRNGFMMMQYSVYGRYCSSEERAKVFKGRIQKILPGDGEVRLISITDIQYGKMKIFHGKRRAAPEEAPEQVEMF